MTQKTNELADAVRLALALSVAGGAVLAAAPARAQEKAEQLETIEVVGSRIKRTDVETSQPVFVLERQDLQRTGLTSIGDILQHISTNGAALNTSFNNGGNGQTSVSLRNLGSQRTLVLVNGRRWPGNAGGGLNGAVDLNTIPVSIVERVEVLKDGASSIYGSDAIAGVVNITTRSSYDGAEASGYLGENEEGDGRVESYDFTIGANTDKANVVMNAAYVKQEPIFAGDRTISATPTANIPGNNVNVGASSSSPFGRFFRTGIPGSVTFDPATGGYKTFDLNVDGFNFAPDNYLSTPQERTSLYVQARYQLTDNVAFRTEGLYNQRRSAQQLAASPLTLGAAFGIPIAIGPGNPFNPFTEVQNRIQYRPRNEFPRLFSQDVDTFHFAGGFEGQFGLFDRNWSWDANYAYSINEQNNITDGLVNIPNLIAALSPDCGVDNNGVACVDVWHGPGAPFTQEMAQAISFVAHDSFEFETWNYTANLTGDIFELPAGPVGFAAGYEYRREQGFDSPDALIASGASSGNIRQPTQGGFALDEMYMEFNIPIVKDLAFAELLELNVAGRYSDYSNFGDTFNPKAGFRWKPISDLLVRGNWSKGFRAPSVGELFLGNSDSFPNLADPCSVGTIENISAAAQQRCLQGFAGIPGVPAGYEQANAQIRITVGGNANLQPEEAITKTLGLVYSPSWAPGLDLYLDWYNIRLSAAIGAPTGQNLIDACYLAGDATACTNAAITRIGSGDIVNLFAGNTNLPGGLETEGWDFTANYKIDTEYGKFTWNWDSTYTSYFGDLGKPDRLECFGTIENGVCIGGIATGNTIGEYLAFFPQWRVRSNLTTNWSFGDWGATLGARYYSPLDEDCSGPADFGFGDLCSDVDNIRDLDGDGIGDEDPRNRIGSRTYWDLQGTWDAPWNARIAVGVNNLTDRDPPFAYSAFANTFDPQYAIPGRFWYVNYTQKF